jgi:hypothetical protein
LPRRILVSLYWFWFQLFGFGHIHIIGFGLVILIRTSRRSLVHMYTQLGFPRLSSKSCPSLVTHVNATVLNLEQLRAYTRYYKTFPQGISDNPPSLPYISIVWLGAVVFLLGCFIAPFAYLHVNTQIPPSASESRTRFGDKRWERLGDCRI